MEKDGCSAANDFGWDGLGGRYMSENVHVVEPTGNSQLLALQIASVMRPCGDAAYRIAANL